MLIGQTDVNVVGAQTLTQCFDDPDLDLIHVFRRAVIVFAGSARISSGKWFEICICPKFVVNMIRAEDAGIDFFSSVRTRECIPGYR